MRGDRHLVQKVPVRFFQECTLRISDPESVGTDSDLAVEDDVAPLDGTYVPDQVQTEREVRTGGGVQEFPGLPVDDADRDRGNKGGADMATRVVMLLSCAAMLLCCGCGGSDREEVAAGETHYDLTGDRSLLTEFECVGTADQEELEKLGLLLGLKEDGLSGADRLTIRQDGQALTFNAEGHVSSYTLEEDGMLVDGGGWCWLLDSDIATPYVDGCLTRSGQVLEDGGVTEITELYETGGHTLTCTHEWEPADAAPSLEA